MLKREQKEGFLQQFRMERKYLLRPDRAKGIPGLRNGLDPSGQSVLVKVWPRDSNADDTDLRDIWRNEIRQLHRLAALPGVGDHISDLASTGEDAIGFYLVLRTGQRVPLESLLQQDKVEPWIAFPSNDADRVVVWRNLCRIAVGLDALHSQGLLHRNLNRWAVLTAGRQEADFQLTGFEWSMRLAGFESPGAKSKTPLLLLDSTLESFFRDWQQLGQLACDLLGIDDKTVRNRSVANHDVSANATADEILLIRELLQVVPTPQIDGERIVNRIDRITTNLDIRVSKRSSKFVLSLNLGPTSRLSEAVREATGRLIEMEDVEGQLRFVQDDLRESPIAISTKINNQSDRFRLIIRGRHLNYLIDDFQLRRTPSNWDLGYCERVEALAPTAGQIIKQVRVDRDDFDIMTLGEAIQRYNRLKGKTASWENIRAKLRSSPATDSDLQRLRKALRLTQVIEYLFAASEVFPIEVVPGRDAKDDSGRPYLYIRPRKDSEREALSMALGLREPLAKRLSDALLGDNVVAEALWTLTDTPKLGEKSLQDTEWEFDASKISNDGKPVYCFTGERSAPLPGHYYLIPNDAVGRDFQFRRRLKYLKALSQHAELAQMLADPRRRVLKSEEVVEEDEDFQGLDKSKQEALTALVSTIPLFLVQGPPGVGKTRLVRGLVKRRFDGDASTRMLLSAQSHYAVDHLLDEVEKIFGTEGDQPLIIRCQSKDKREESSKFDLGQQAKGLLEKLAKSSLVEGSVPNIRDRITTLSDAYGSEPSSTDSSSNNYIQRAFEGLVLRSANAVFATTNSAELERLIDEKGQFDWAIVEEAGKATGGELLGPLLLSHRRLMIGDHKQLPPYGSEEVNRLLQSPENVREALRIGNTMIGRRFRDTAIDEIFTEIEDQEEDSESEFSDLCSDAVRAYSLFETLIEDEFERQKMGAGRPIAAKLNTQHRMHPAIAKLVSQSFYKGELDTDPDRAAEFQSSKSPILSIDVGRLPETPVVWVNMPWVQDTIGKKDGERFPKWNNPDEVRAVQHTLGLVRGEKQPSIAILSPYAHQVRRIDSAISLHLSSQFSHLKQFSSATKNEKFCHTVDSFQGSEADLVIVSLVRNNQHGTIATALGFLADPRRMNVLLSRARWKLVIVGSLGFLDSVRRVTKSPEDMQRLEFLQILMKTLPTMSSEEISIVPFATLCGANT